MLEELKSHHREVARLKFEGYKPAEIADQMGMPISSVRLILKDPLCKALVQKLGDQADEQVIDVRKRLAEMNVYALDVIENILRDEYGHVPANTQLNAAKDVLDRTGYQAVQRTENIHAHMTRDELEEIKKRAFGNRVSHNHEQGGSAG